MNSEDLKKRTKKFALDIIKFTESLPHTRVMDVLGKQLLRAGTSVGANYRSACRAKSQADFIAKMKLVEEEADESSYWLELIDEFQRCDPPTFEALVKEAQEILAIAVASINTARKKLRTSFSESQSTIYNRQSKIKWGVTKAAKWT
ncbi:MAG: four helix bundle protein [Aquabacterium sp.]|uniref:four helix bundle protein n=1 Tax=Aquabacterium sp. TaxID=1872578 RepID=UPI003BB223DF